ncbi:MAG: hypothetical protein ACFB03_04145 [Paracoccaceae bacterium]
MPKMKKDISPPAARPLPPQTKPQVLERLDPNHGYVPRQGLDRNRLIMWLAVIVIAGQLLMPEHLKPFYLAGEAAAMFHGALFDEVNRKELELLQQQAIAQKIADLQAEYASWKGICALTGAFDPVAGTKCMQAADSYFQNALRQIRGSDLIYR